MCYNAGNVCRAEQDQALQSIGDIIQVHARQRGRTDGSPLALVRAIDAVPGERVGHLPVSSELGQAWLAFTGEPFRPHQAHALLALRRGEAVALRADSGETTLSALFLMYSVLAAEAPTTALILADQPSAADGLAARLAQLDQHLPASLRLSSTLADTPRLNAYARIVVCTAETLHQRVLRHHDRAWQLFWSRLGMLVIPNLDQFRGVAGAHLADLVLRTRRLAGAYRRTGRLPILATLPNMSEPEPALTTLFGTQCRVVGADDSGAPSTQLAVWRAGPHRLRDAAELAVALQRNGYFVHVHCSPLEISMLVPIVGDVPAITVGPDTGQAQVIVCAGFPESVSRMRRMLRSGAQAVVVVLGERPLEQALARQPDGLVSAPATAWPPPSANAYIIAQHVLCAASEMPLSSAEVEYWGVGEVVERLVASGHLTELPDDEAVWIPGPQADDPYLEFHLGTVSGPMLEARNEQGRPVAALDPTWFERWAFQDGALPPAAGGMRVVGRNDEQATITVRLESVGRRVYPLRRCSVNVREEREQRSLVGGARLGLGRVLVDEEIYGYRELAAGAAAGESKLRQPLTNRWTSTACWFDVRSSAAVQGQLIGWCLAMALPVRALCAATDLVPCYVAEQQRLYFVDAQPGGSGLAQWLFANAEQMLPLAYDIAYACRHDVLLEPISRVDMDWLLTLLGRSVPASEPVANGSVAVIAPPAAANTSPGAMPAKQPPEQPFIELPPRVAPDARAARHTSAERQEKIAKGDTGARQENRESSRPAPEPPRRPVEPAPETRARPASEPTARQSGLDGPDESSTHAPPARPEPPPEPADEPPDATALIERLRRQREQREASQQKRQPTPPAPHVERGPVVQRFQPGDRVFCLPYGDGVVHESRVGNGSEVLIITFPDYGDLEVDPAVSLVRKVEDARDDDSDLL